MKLKVSVITPCYNASKYIGATIRSVINQTYENWEMLIVDDCSTDDSIEIIEKFARDDSRIRLFRQERNMGPGLARNLATKMATGNIIALIDSDDLWERDKLERQVRGYESSEKTVMIFCDYEHIDELGNLLNRRVTAPSKVSYNKMLKSNFIGSLTGTYSVDRLGKRYFIKHPHEDYILWLSILKEGYVADNIRECLAQYRVSRHSRSANKVKSAIDQWNIYRNIEKISVIKSLFFLACYSIYGIKKHY